MIPRANRALPLRQIIRLLPAIARSVLELAIARFRHRRLQAQDIKFLNTQALNHGRAAIEATADDAQLVQQIGYIVPRVANRLPWRADCLVQAMAAQHWLANKGIAATITIGVDKSDRLGFEAHAWLNYGDVVVTGGQISSYTVMIQHEGNA